MKLHRWILVLLFSAVGFPALAQQPAASGPEWQITKKTDPSSGTRNVVFTLAGKFLTPPKSGSSDHPTLVVTCNPDKHVRGLLGNLVSATLNENEAGQIVMQFDMPDPTQMAKTCGIFEKK